MKHVLVTGGIGFIGGYVVEELERRGYRPHVFDRKSWTADVVASSPNRIELEYVFGDIKDATLVDDAISHVDGVIHLAGILGTQETVADPRPAAETNILGGLNVISACAKYDVPLVNIAVGNYWMNNTYSITKNAIERFVEMKRVYEGRVMTSVRALNAYGPRQVPSAPYGPSRVRKVMPSFICRALVGEPIEVYGDGEQVMDMVYVEDVAKILVSTLELLEASRPDLQRLPEQTIEAGTGRWTTVMEIAQMVAAEVQEQRHSGTPTIRTLPMRPGESPQSVVLGNPETLAPLGIKAEDLMPLEDGIARTVAYFVDYMQP